VLPVASDAFDLGQVGGRGGATAVMESLARSLWLQVRWRGSKESDSGTGGVSGGLCSFLKKVICSHYRETTPHSNREPSIQTPADREDGASGETGGVGGGGLCPGSAACDG